MVASRGVERRALPLLPSNAVGCARCVYLSSCGGLEDAQAGLFGCLSQCGGCRDHDNCDYVCPRKPDFLWWMASVGGPYPVPRRALPAVKMRLGEYVPMLRHGSASRGELPLAAAALGTFEVLGGRGLSRDRDGASMRRRNNLRLDAEVMLVSVKQDRPLEAFWANRTREKLSLLKLLGLGAMTVPNYSFLTDAPRIHTIYNFWRIVRVAEELAEVGIPPILHVNALCKEDWHRWGRVLRESPASRHVCKEFNTGLQDPKARAAAIEGLRELQDKLGRELHVVAVGGLRVAHLLAPHFTSITVVDSVPFIASMKRRRLVSLGDAMRQEPWPTPLGEPIDDVVVTNLSVREAHVGRVLERARRRAGAGRAA